MKKNFIHIIESTATGSLTAMRGLANSQKEDGHNVLVIFSRRPDTPNNLTDYFNDGIELKNVQMAGFFNIFLSFFKIYKIIQLFRPNIIFLTSSTAGFIGRVIGLFINKKILIFYIPQCISYMRKDIGVFKRFLFIFFEKIGSIKKSVLIASSNSELNEIRKIIKNSPSHLVENAVTDEYLDLIPHQKKHKNIIHVGGIRVQKDPESFAIIAKKVMQKNKDIKFTWVGDGDKKSKKQLMEVGIEVTGWLPTSDVKNRLLNSTLYLSTARWEAMPLSLLEALACGLPIVASNCAGNVDILENKDLGFIFESIDEAVEKIIFLMNNHSEIKRLSSNATDISNKWFNVKRYYKEINSIVKKMEEKI